MGPLDGPLDGPQSGPEIDSIRFDSIRSVGPATGPKPLRGPKPGPNTEIELWGPGKGPGGVHRPKVGSRGPPENTPKARSGDSTFFSLK